MFDTFPAAPRSSAGSRLRARSTRLSRVAALARTPGRSSLTETLSVGLGLTRR